MTLGEQVFRERLTEISPRPWILELGTLQSEAGRSTHHMAWLPEGDWLRGDIEPGADVDVVTDAHKLDNWDPGSFDAYVAVSLYEHLERPWIAAEAAARVLKPGGLLYVATHQSFPLHGYPSDFFRFSDAALALIFTDAGFEVLYKGYAYACQIIPPPEVSVWNPAAPAWLNVEVAAVRT